MFQIFLFAELRGAGVPFPSTNAATPAPTTPTINPSQVPQGFGDSFQEFTGSVFGQGYANLQNIAGNIDPGIANLTNLFFADGGPFSLFINAMTPLVAIGLILWSLHLIVNLSEYGGNIFSSNQFQFILANIVLTGALFVNNGHNLGLVVRAGNAIGAHINQSVLDWQVNGTSNRQAIRTAAITTEIYSASTKLMEGCKLVDPKKYEKCKTDAYQKAINVVKAKHRDVFTQAGKALSTAVNIGVTLSTAKESVGMIIALLAVASCFSIIFKLSVLAWNLSAPIWLAINLMPMPKKPFVVYITGMFAVSFAQIMYSMIQGIIAFALAFIPSTPILLALLMGCFAPALALAITSGSSMAVFGLLSGTSVWVAKNVGSMTIGKFTGKK